MAAVLDRISALWRQTPADDDINEPVYAGTERQPPVSFIAANQSTSSFGNYPPNRRTWAEGSWATPAKPRSKWCSPSIANVFVLSLLAISVPFLFSFLGDRSSLNSFMKDVSSFAGSSSSDAPRSAAARGPPRLQRAQQRRHLEEAEKELKREMERRKEGEREEQQQHAGWQKHEQEQEQQEQHVGGARGEKDARGEARTKVLGAAKEIAELDSKISHLQEASKMAMLRGRMEGRDEQETQLESAEAEIARLDKLLDRLQEQERARLKNNQEERRRVSALEKENEALERGVMDKDEDRKEIEQLTQRVAQLSLHLSQRKQIHRTGEAARIKNALQAHLEQEAAKVKALTQKEIALKAQLEAAHQELVASKVKARAAEHRQQRHAQDLHRHAQDLHSSLREHRHASSASSDGVKKPHLGYTAEVEAKEKAEEDRITRQANAMVDKETEEAGLDEKHRRMLENIERRKAARDRQADNAGSRDLQAREKEIDDMLGTNTNCPGPNCMAPHVSKSLQDATKYASSHYAEQDY